MALARRFAATPCDQFNARPHLLSSSNLKSRRVIVSHTSAPRKSAAPTSISTSKIPLNTSFGSPKWVPGAPSTYADFKCMVTILPGSTPETQKFSVSDDFSVEMPVAAFQKLPVEQQTAAFVGIWAALTSSAFLLCTQTDLQWTQDPISPYLFGVIFMAAGVAHFTAHKQFCSMMPPQGTWGLWNLPGSDSFHVNWSGVAEIAGGTAMLASTLPPVADSLPWLRSLTSACLLALCVAVTPANIFMATHNAPGPGPEGKALPLVGHAVRGVMQVVLWSALWGLTFPPSV